MTSHLQLRQCSLDVVDLGHQMIVLGSEPNSGRRPSAVGESKDKKGIVNEEKSLRRSLYTACT